MTISDGTLEIPLSFRFPETPAPETFVEAESHAAGEPLAITREIQPQDGVAAANDEIKDAKAS